MADADTCVKCALCLPHCPTYKLSLDEGESPRGRIALMQGLASGELEDTETLRGHLDRCLNCRACEAVCPVPVPYGRLIDAGQSLLNRDGNRGTWQTRWVLRLAPQRWFWWLAGLATNMGGRLLRLLGLAGLFYGLFPVSRHAAARHYRLGGVYHNETDNTPSQPASEVDLFLGCVADPFDACVHNAAIRVLTRLGYTVHIPAKQTCCGALHWHAGDRATACQLAKQNQAMRTAKRPLVSTATGCGAHLREYSEVMGESATDFSNTTHDINTFLVQSDWPETLTFKPLTARVAVHLPCTQRNVLRDSDSVVQLLQRIPGIDIAPLAHKDCCGAAGVYFLNHPDNARALGELSAKAIQASDASILVTANIGCAMHLQKACQRLGHQIEILHPIELLARQLARRFHKFA